MDGTINNGVLSGNITIFIITYDEIMHCTDWLVIQQWCNQW